MSKYPSKNAKKEWIPPAMTADYLRGATSQYLGRYVPSEYQLKQVLWRKIDKNIRVRGSGDRSAYEMMVVDELTYRQKTGDLDDVRFAAAWVESLHRRGKSKLQIRVKLQQKGIAKTTIAKSLEVLEEGEEDHALIAAIRYARKRRCGPFQLDPKKRIDRKQKDVASMMRAGHSYDCIKKIMACQTLDEIEELEQEATSGSNQRF